MIAVPESYNTFSKIMLKCCWRPVSKPPGLNRDYAHSVALKHVQSAAHLNRLNRTMRDLTDVTETVTGAVRAGRLAAVRK